MKKYLKLKKEGRRYEFKESNDAVLSTLYFFLEDSCRCVGKFKELINDPTQERGGGNVTLWEKKGNKITITLDFLDDPYEDAFEVTIEKLNCILDQWEELLTKMPEEIIIVRDDIIESDSPVILEENKLISK